MRPISKETFITNRVNIDQISGRKKDIPERTSSHAIFLFDEIDKEREKKLTD